MATGWGIRMGQATIPAGTWMLIGAIYRPMDYGTGIGTPFWVRWQGITVMTSYVAGRNVRYEAATARNALSGIWHWGQTLTDLPVGWEADMEGYDNIGDGLTPTTCGPPLSYEATVWGSTLGPLRQQASGVAGVNTSPVTTNAGWTGVGVASLGLRRNGSGSISGLGSSPRVLETASSSFGTASMALYRGPAYASTTTITMTFAAPDTASGDYAGTSSAIVQNTNPTENA